LAELVRKELVYRYLCVIVFVSNSNFEVMDRVGKFGWTKNKIGMTESRIINSVNIYK